MSKRIRHTQARHAPGDAFTQALGDPPPEASGHRQGRLEHILLDELQSLVRDEATDPSLDGIQLLAVHLSPDGGHARIAYSVAAPLEAQAEVEGSSRAGLARATGFLRARLAQQLDLKRLPKLTFTLVGLVGGGDACPE